MSTTGFRVTGLRDVIKGLRAVEGGVRDMTEAFGTLARAGAEETAKEVPRRTGTLARTIKASKAKTYAQVRIGNARVPYAGPVAWGWPARGIVGDRFPVRVDAKMRPKAMVVLSAFIERLKRRNF